MVVDVSNSPSFDDDPAMEFFTKSTTNLPAAAKDAGIRHYVAVSIVGCDQFPRAATCVRRSPRRSSSKNRNFPTRPCVHPIRGVRRRDHSVDDGRPRDLLGRQHGN